MSTAYEVTGRTEQKQRTRQALVAAARNLVASGKTPTVEDAAGAAGISRTTAYRYFPNQRALLGAAHPETGRRSMLPPDPPQDPAQRLAAVIGEFTRMILRTEAQQRTMLRLSLEADEAERAALPLRQAGRSAGSKKPCYRCATGYLRPSCTDWFWRSVARWESRHWPGLPTSHACRGRRRSS